MNLPIEPPFEPMEARSADEIPATDHWQYEPKWDGFRCVLFRDGDEVYLQSKAGQPLARCFPELVQAALKLPTQRFVVDGEIVIPISPAVRVQEQPAERGQKKSSQRVTAKPRAGAASVSGAVFAFDALLMRIHPAESRVRKLSVETPAMLIVFDLLVDDRGRSLLKEPLNRRRNKLEQFARKNFTHHPSFQLSPVTTDAEVASERLQSAGERLDGIIAKAQTVPYRSGERDGMVKVKKIRTVDCVVGGFRYGQRTRQVGSLLLGLYDENGLLHHVGFTSNIPHALRKQLTEQLESLRKPPGFTGRAPGGPSRWSTERSTQWEPLLAKLVVEVTYDHFTNGRFRHGTSFHRFRPEKKPKQCTFEQLGIYAAAIAA